MSEGQAKTRVMFGTRMILHFPDQLRYPEIMDRPRPRFLHAYANFLDTRLSETEEQAWEIARDWAARYPEAEIMVTRHEQVWYPGSALGDRAAWFSPRVLRVTREEE